MLKNNQNADQSVIQKGTTSNVLVSVTLNNSTFVDLYI